jgi:hypothetical protein
MTQAEYDGLETKNENTLYLITADKVFKGSTEIIRIYKGTTLEWEKSVPIPDADAYIQDGLVF